MLNKTYLKWSVFILVVILLLVNGYFRLIKPQARDTVQTPPKTYMVDTEVPEPYVSAEMVFEDVDQCKVAQIIFASLTSSEALVKLKDRSRESVHQLSEKDIRAEIAKVSQKCGDVAISRLPPLLQ